MFIFKNKSIKQQLNTSKLIIILDIEDIILIKIIKIKITNN